MTSIQRQDQSGEEAEVEIASCPGRVFLPGSWWEERFVPETGFNFLETRQARIGKEDLNGYLHIFTPFP